MTKINNWIFKDIYNKDLAEKEVNVAYSRVMLLGSAGVGKTSFTRSLMKLGYRKDTNSTIVSDVHSICPIDSNNTQEQPVFQREDAQYQRPDRFISPYSPSRRPDDYTSHFSSDRYKRHDSSTPHSQDQYWGSNERGECTPSSPQYSYRQRPSDEYLSRAHQQSYSRRDDSDEYSYRRAEEPNRYALQQDHDRFLFDSRKPHNCPKYEQQSYYRQPERYGHSTSESRPDNPVSTPDDYERRPDEPDDSSSKTKRFFGRQPYEEGSRQRMYEYNSASQDFYTDQDQSQPYDSTTGLPVDLSGSSWERLSDEPHHVSKDRPVQYQRHMLSNEQWKVVNDDDEIDEVAHLLAAVYDTDYSASEFLRKTVAAMSLYKAESLIKPSDLIGEKIQMNEVESFLLKAKERADQLTYEQKQDIKPQPFMHIWDCGGQAVFLEILPAFLTSRTMFFLLFNAAKNLEEKWKDVSITQGNEVCNETTNMSTKDLLFNWMANIHHHLVQLDERGAFLSYPRIYCIGTHGDQLKRNEQKAIVQKIKSEYNSKAFAHLVKGTLIVDNTTAGSYNEDPNFSFVRREVQNFTCEKLIVKTPVSWVLFRKVIKMLDKKVISLKEAHKIGLACRIPHHDVPKVLLFYHDLGVILYYQSIKGLQDKVITNPQWFVDTLGKVFTLEGREVEDMAESMWNLLRKFGILVRPLYQEVWKDVVEIEPDDMMELLVHFRLAAQVKTEKFYIRDAAQYFLPAVLKSFDLSSQPLSSDFPPVARAANLHITFSTDFVPPGFFTRLITSFTKIPTCNICFEDGVFRNRITFKFGDPDVDQVTFTDLCDSIRVSIERYSDAPDITPFHNTCQNLRKILEKCKNEVDEALANKSSRIQISRKFRYECTASECRGYEAHFIVDALGQKVDLPLYCEKKKPRRKPTPEESYWFIETKQTSENVSELLA